MVVRYWHDIGIVECLDESFKSIIKYFVLTENKELDESLSRTHGPTRLTERERVVYTRMREHNENVIQAINEIPDC